MTAGRLRSLGVATAVLVAVALAAPAFGAFPGTDPAESPRINTPNDPAFDRCETDDETPDVERCNSYFDEQFKLFGFRPDSAFADPVTKTPTTYPDCSQLDAAGRAANVAAGDPECSQIGGIRADGAWKYSTGDPETVVAILDTGIEWDEEELIDKVHLNRAELPEPQTAGPALREGLDCAGYTGSGYDRNADGAVNVADYACDPRLRIEAGDDGASGQPGADELLDASDLIATFSDGGDADGNGYVDDIAGWDFFDDDNDPFDASSCCSADGHGTGRAEEAVAATDNGEGDAGVCPECQVMPMRVWDTFVVDTNLFALAVVYATDNGASVVEGAVGGLLNSSFARRAFTYADGRGVTLTLVSSDINSANHNYPTNYNEAIYVGGALPDSAPTGEDCTIPGLPGIGGGVSSDECAEFFRALRDGTGGALPTTQIPTTSFFRNSNLTQYGGKADIVLMGSTGSENTGQASGAAALLASYGREVLDRPLSGNEIRQLLTMTAEDVLPANTGSIGLPDKAGPGWDPHFGYGRVNLAAAMARIAERRIPPEAQLDAPDWFTPINVDKVGDEGVAVKGRVAGPHVDGGLTWTLEYACGQDAADGRDYRSLASGAGPQNGELGRLSKGLLAELADECDGSVSGDAGRPAGRPTDPWPVDPYPDPDPERHAFQVRLTVREADDAANTATYRKTLFAYRDDGTLAGWPRPVGSGSVPEDHVTGSGGESSPRLVDLDADNRLDILLPTSSGELHVLRGDGTPLPSFNGGRPVITEPYSAAASHAGAGGLGDGVLAEAPREPLRVPAVGDVTGDGEPDIVATAGERVYVWGRRGRPARGFPQRVRLELSAPCKAGAPSPCFAFEQRNLTRDKHLKRGFFGSPALADMDGDGRLDIVAGALDQHLYAWTGRGELLPGFPVRLDGGSEDDGAEIVTSPAIAELDGDPTPEVVIATNEVLDGSPPEGFPNLDDLQSLFVGAATGVNPVYAINSDGSRVPGWPVDVGVLAGDLLPLVLPAHDAAVADLDGDGRDEVTVSAGTGAAKLVDSDGEVIKTYQNVAGPASSVLDQGVQLNLADYPAIGRLTAGGPLSVFKGGLSVNGAANLLAVNQNLPFNHVAQAWSISHDSGDPTNGAYLPGFPVATDDFQLLSQPLVAKVDAAGGGRQALTGTGLYQLHAYGAGGREPPGWPKFMGGWVQSTPAVGDVSGDGKLDVMAFTREGWSFAWGTEADACAVDGAATNAEWWTFHHDEHGTANYGTDSRPPSRPGRLAVRRVGGGLQVSFEGSGDDLGCGRAARYEVAGAGSPIESGADFGRAQRLEARPAGAARAGAGRRISERERAGAAGSAPNRERMTLAIPGGARFDRLAVRAVDDAGNPSYVRAAGVPAAQRGGDGGGRGGEGRGGDDGGGAPGGRGDDLAGGGSDEGTEGGGSGGDDPGGLPFTGLALALLAALGLALLGGGSALRRRTRRISS